jgi:intein/homing endonuclease
VQQKTILLVLGDNNIRLPNLGRFRKTRHCDDNFFKKLTPLSSYWLGFIAADGCLTSAGSRLSLGISSKDKDYLRKFRRAIKSNSKIGNRPSTKSVVTYVYSEKIFRQLVGLGILPNKSLNIERVTVPEELMSHFIRGVFDGDGWAGGEKVTHLQFQIAGNGPFLKQIQEVLVKNCMVNEVKLYSLYGGTVARRLQYTGFQVLRILDFLYKDSLPEMRLERKYEKYLGLKKKFVKS